MPKSKKKKEALTVNRFINEVLVDQLKIPLKQIVNDTPFEKFTGSKRPDLLISDVEYDIQLNNDIEYIKNLVAYAEAKDNCVVDDSNWKDAYKNGLFKSKKLGISYFIVTNCKISYFYNSSNGKELKLNGNPIREFQSLDVLRLISKKIEKNEKLTDISTNVDTQSSISEAIFNKRLWELANIYRGVDFNNITEKIDFTIGFISLKFFEEKAALEGFKDKTKDYWSDLRLFLEKPDTFIANLSGYIRRLEKETDFQEFKDLMEIVNKKINSPDIDQNDVIEIFNIIDGMGILHGCGFDLFGAVYEMFASSKEKGDFGEFFTRRHYAHIFTKLLLKDELFFDKSQPFMILDPACGTGGFLTEAYKILYNNYKGSGTINSDSLEFLKDKCIYGYDVKNENISRTKLNMFLVGDGHANIQRRDSLKEKLYWNYFDYIVTNPPMGYGTVKAETSSISTIRYEISFLTRIVKLLKVGKKACVIMPDGFFENPSIENFRIEILRSTTIFAIISLPKFAFAPYTKEKTYAFFFIKRSSNLTNFQKKAIWMYIIDNDGFANSDKRFPTKLKNANGSWMHDEISAWVDINGDEKKGLLEERWLKYDDFSSGGTIWLNEKGEKIKLRKGGFIKIADINKKNFHNLLPEFHLRPYEPSYVKIEDVDSTLDKILNDLKSIDL